VFFNGSSYISLAGGNVGNTPTNGAPWALLAQQGSAGTPGAPGAPGTPGAAGATGSQGPPVSFQGTWSNLTTYATGDSVFFNGSSYISLAGGNLGNTPTNGAPWALLAQQGAAGTPGAPGAPGTPGAVGATGATGAPGLQGPPVTFQGTWSNLTTYAGGDTVFFSGSSYISLSAGNIGNTPTSGAPWALLAQQGATGPGGTGQVYQGRSTSPSATTAYWNIGSGLHTTTEAAADTLMPVACTFNRMEIQFRQADVAHAYTFTLRVNGADTAVTCSLSSSTSGTVSCSDSTHTAAVSANDLVDIEIVDTTGGTTPSAQILFGLVCQ
jgi:hypothetical protein